MPNPTVPIPGNAEVVVQPLIHRGDRGDAVRTVQQRLQAIGFYRGIIDGDYGDQTAQAVASFQQAIGISPTGNIDTRTLRELGFEVDPVPSPAIPMGMFTPEMVAKMFPGAPIQNIQANLPYVLQALAQFGLGDPAMTLVALSTIRAETGSFAPISEYKSKYNTSPNGAPYDLYDFRSDLGNRGKGDGARFKGRGFIQLTGRHNYQVYSQRLGLGNQLLDQPELANQPDIAARILACFLKDKENTIRQALVRGDYAAARKAVNGGTHGLEAFEMAFSVGIQLTGLA
jgi:peptidoglycan L-alanyl-D-glutamate endopeptidase CwlK